METRELYKQKAEAQIKEWGAKLDALKAQAEKLTAQAKLSIQPHIEAAHAKYTAAQVALDKAEAATDEKWDEITKDIESAWNDFKGALEGTFDALKGLTESKTEEESLEQPLPEQPVVKGEEKAPEKQHGKMHRKSHGKRMAA